MKIDFHVHSIESQDGTASLCHIAKAAASAGLDGVFICDHNKQSLKEPVFMEGVWLLPGCEVSAGREHILALLCEKDLPSGILSGETLPSAADVISEIHGCGGIAVIAHPYAHGQKDSWKYEDMEAEPDCIECANARAWMKDPDANRKAEAAAEKYSRVKTGGSDAHLTDEIGHAYTELDCEDIQGIKDAILKGRTKPVLRENTKRIYKGYSQLERRNRSGRSSQKLIGITYLIKCWLYDLLKK